MISFERNKSPGNGGLTKEFYKTLWKDFKDAFFNLITRIQMIKVAM